MDRLLDHARTGSLYLQQPEMAQMVVEAIYYREQDLKHYDLHAFVVMANHVHLLITPRVAVSKLMQSLKRFTGLEGNRMLGLAGPFWQDESYDRLVRDGMEFERIVRYIERNPVNAGLGCPASANTATHLLIKRRRLLQLRIGDDVVLDPQLRFLLLQQSLDLGFRRDLLGRIAEGRKWGEILQSALGRIVIQVAAE